VVGAEVDFASFPFRLYYNAWFLVCMFHQVARLSHYGIAPLSVRTLPLAGGSFNILVQVGLQG
jgi:hypothetical protein